jgi:hypothetical protein
VHGVDVRQRETLQLSSKGAYLLPLAAGVADEDLAASDGLFEGVLHPAVAARHNHTIFTYVVHLATSIRQIRSFLGMFFGT